MMLGLAGGISGGETVFEVVVVTCAKVVLVVTGVVAVADVCVIVA
jgi:hypothetical protein